MHNLEWLNINGNRKYPFMHECSLKSIYSYQLPNNIFVDAILQLNTQYSQYMYLSKIEYSPEIFKFTINNAGNNDIVMIGTKLNPNTTDINFSIRAEGINTYYSSYGIFVIGTLKDLLYGCYEFANGNALFEPCKVQKLCSGISSINNITEGNVMFKSGTNVVISTDGNNINIDTSDGLCACIDNPCIKTINKLSPVNNDFRIEGVSCVRVEPISNGIRITNVCEDSCCGCDEINAFIERMDILEKRILALESL